MKREQLTNVTTESIDQRCADLAHDAMQYCRWIVTAKHENQLILRKCVTGQIVAEYANAIVSLRSQQVTPFDCKLCGQHITDGKPCGCGARPVTTWHQS